VTKKEAKFTIDRMY